MPCLCAQTSLSNTALSAAVSGGSGSRRQKVKKPRIIFASLRRNGAVTQVLTHVVHIRMAKNVGRP
jgi:hypothetical protein